MLLEVSDPSLVERRCELVPPCVSGELLRLRLVEQLGRRWDAVVTTVVAGAGLGKSTALAQALRHNHAHPRGIDAWVSCEPGDEDADHLAGAICRALGASTTRSDGASSVTNALRAMSPLPVCLVIDDLHELPDDCSAVALLTQVLRSLPAHAHLVLAGRRIPALPLSRLRAADRVVDITPADLTFTGAEVETLAAESGHGSFDRDDLDALGGWPALVRLALGARAGGTRQFVWEEIVCGLSPDDRRALLALATMGTADADSLADLCGTPVDLEHLVATIPMVAHTGDGRIRAHDLWHGTLTALLPAADVCEMGRAAGLQLLDHGAYLRAGSLAARLGDPDTLCAAALALVRNTLSSLPVDTAAAWHRAAPSAHRDRPELVLLEATLRHAVSDHDPEVDRLIAHAVSAFRACGDVAGEQIALGLRLVVAHTRGDVLAAMELVGATAHLKGLEHDPALRALAPAVAATEAHLLGDVERGAAILDNVCVHGLPPTVAAAILRYRWHLLVFSGRAADAARLAPDVLAKATTPNAPLFAPMARWLAGDPDGFDGVTPTGLDDFAARVQTIAVPYVRDWLNYGMFTSIVWASKGDADVVGRALQLIGSLDVRTDTARDGAPVAVAVAACAIVHHDDERARATIEEVIDRHPLTDRFTEVCLRRFLAIPYVCSDRARQFWDAQALGPSHRLQRDVARALLTSRDGLLTPAELLPGPAAVHTALPLPWAIELAVRAHAARHAGGLELAQWLVDRLGAVARDELHRWWSHDDEVISSAAQCLLATITLPPGKATRIELLGPVRLLEDGAAVDRPEQRRARVRELLAVLAIHPTLGRERAMDLLWPELSSADAARNLRVTLTHLRKWLEPVRTRGEDGYHLRVDADHLRLLPSDQLSVDVWELHHHLRAAAAAKSAGAAAEQAEHLQQVVDLWRGDPLRDLERVPDLDHETQHVRLQLVDATLSLGELRLAEGNPWATVALAERALAADPFAERAFRLLIAAHLLRGDRAQTTEAARRTLVALADLGVEPDGCTEILLRQAGVGDLVAP